MSVKVCFISHSSAKGGAEKALPKLLEALQSKGLKVYVLLPAYGPMAEDLRDRNITFCIYPYRTWMRPHVSFWKRIRRTIFNFLLVVPIAVRIWRWRCDVVYTNTITVSVGAFAAKLIRRPHIWHIREFGYEDHGLDFDMGIGLSLCLVQRLSLLCITNSNAVAEKYKRFITPQKLKVIYEAYNNTNRNQKCLFEFNEEINKAMDIRCIIVGSLQDGKGQADAIMAVKELRRKGINAQLYIVG